MSGAIEGRGIASRGCRASGFFYSIAEVGPTARKLPSAVISLPAHETYRVYRWLWDRSASTPIEIYTLGTSPYEIGGSENTFYRRDAVVLHPIASSDALRVALASPSRVPRYISYRGLTASSVVSEAGVYCPTVIQTFPEWFVRLVGAGLLADAQLLTICGPV